MAVPFQIDVGTIQSKIKKITLHVIGIIFYDIVIYFFSVSQM